MAKRSESASILPEPRAVVICTEYRGVFFGYLAEDQLPEKVVLANARNCVHWSSDIKGVLGLAATGPSKGCRIGPRVPQLTLWKITAVIDCTPESVQNWEDNKWSS